MKNFIFILASLGVCLTGFGQTSVYTTGGVSREIGTTELNSPSMSTGNILSIGASPTTFNANINKQVAACTEIDLAPGTDLIAPTTPTNSLELSIVSGKLDIYSYSHSDFTQIHALEKFETGVEIPQEIATRIAAYKANDQDTNGLNPFMEWDIALKVTYTHQTTGYSHFNYGFYFEDWQRHAFGGDANKPNWDWTFTANSNEFRVRYAFPEKNGVWDVQYELFVEGELYYSYCPFEVEVIDKNPGDGFVEVADNNSVLQRNGDLFLPIGENMTWPDEYPRDGGIQTCAYHTDGTPCESASHYYFDQMLEDYAASGVDYFRILLSPSSFDIEFEKIGNYFERLNYANEIDRVIQFAADNDMYVDFNMLVHYGLMDGPVYGLFAWDGSSRHWNGYLDSYAEKEYCYVSDLNLSTTAEFLTNADAKKYYKQKVRYLISRWGYSQNIAMFELISEINSVGQEVLVEYNLPADTIITDTSTWWKWSKAVASPAPYFNDYSHRQNTYLWQKEMAEYIKNDLMHRDHLLTCSYANAPWADDPTFGIPELDLMSFNFYNNTDLNYVPNLQNMLRDFKNTYKKPIILSETGPLSEVPCDGHTSYTPLLWQSAFLGTAGFNYWTSRTVEYAPQWAEMKRMKDWIMNDPLKKAILLGNWDVGHANGTVRGDSTDNYFYRKDFNYIYDTDPPVFQSYLPYPTQRVFGAMLNLTDNYRTNAISDTLPCYTGNDAEFKWINDRMFYETQYLSSEARISVKNDLASTDDPILLPWEDANSEGTESYWSYITWADFATFNPISGFEESSNNPNPSIPFQHPVLYATNDSVQQYGLRSIMPFVGDFYLFTEEGMMVNNGAHQQESKFAAFVHNNELKITPIQRRAVKPAFTSDNPTANKYTMYITNTLGQTIYSGVLDLNLNEPIETSNFPKGLIIISLVANNEKHVLRCVNY